MNSTNNKRIAKNTIFLYLRMFITMGVSLYTSRIVLDTLGEVDFGLYNVIGGIVSMFTIINFAMTCSTTRFITFELGKRDSKRLNLVFSTSVIIHFLIAVIILILAETIGLWFLNNKLVIPESRMVAANWVFQFSVLSCIIMVISVPYKALIVSHEKMNAFAYISVVETILKLVIVYMLVIGGYDKLILYAILMFAISFVIRIIFQLYCHKVFNDIKFKFVREKRVRKEMFTYAFWSLTGSASVMLADQGQNILLNMYFGPAVNAARGVSFQVKNAIQQFSNNFQQAVNPQINKSFAEGNVDYMHSLVITSSKFSFYLLYILSLPVFFEIEMVLSWWLKEVPQHTGNFIRLMIIISVLTALEAPISNAAGATGRIRNYQLIVGGIMILVVPFSYLTLQIKATPEFVFIAQIIVTSVGLILSLTMIRRMINFSLKIYLKEVILTCFRVTIVSSLLPMAIYYFMPSSIWSFFAVCLSCVLSTLLSIYALGLKENERKFIDKKVMGFFTSKK